nr:uncharacterized protein LOC128696895 [Cherax quadricarinatus]
MSDCEREHCVLALLLLLLVFDSCHAERSVGGDGVGPPMIQQKYMVMWTEVATGPFSVWVDNNDDLKSIACSSNDNCTAALYGLDVALSYDTSLPSEPYCRFAHSEHQDHQDGLGYCTCGPEKCVSYSREYNNNGEPFYYCGPCGWVGSECYNTTCTHPLAECINDYCECLNYGLFYDLSYCYIPFYGKELVAVMLITTIIVVILCTFLAYGYHRLRNRSRRGFPESWFRGNVTRQSVLVVEEEMEKGEEEEEKKEIDGIADPLVDDNFSALSFPIPHLPALRYEDVPCSVDEKTCNIEELSCRSDEDCEDAFPNLQLAIDLGKDSTVPSLPFCTNHFTRSHSTCLPGYVGSECRNKSCTHTMAECVDSFCECSGGGIFYEFSFCDIPFMGYETALQIVIIICIAIACCMIIASLYSIFFGRRLPGRVPRLLLRRRRHEGTRESPERDAPPSYDEVANKLPTYQDALRMATLVSFFLCKFVSCKFMFGGSFSRRVEREKERERERDFCYTINASNSVERKKIKSVA